MAFWDCGIERRAAAGSVAGAGGGEQGREWPRDGGFGAGSGEERRPSEGRAGTAGTHAPAGGYYTSEPRRRHLRRATKSTIGLTGRPENGLASKGERPRFVMGQMIAIPPVEFRELVCGVGAADTFEAVGCQLRDFLDQLGMLLTSGVSLLDVGCGCGRLARYLTELPIGSYTGFDRHKGMVDWCVREISSQDPRFRFDYFELKSAYTVLDGQAGTIDAETFRFPYADAAFDSVVLASVFTHMPPGETRQYLGEMARVMRPGAKALFSVFLSPTGTTEARDTGMAVYYSHAGLLADMGALPFSGRFVVPGMPGSELAQPEPEYGKHNWYVLTRSKAL